MQREANQSSDVLCFSHLRWGFVFQRPNHLMARAAQSGRVFFIEEPILDDALAGPRLDSYTSSEGVMVCTPHLPAGTQPEQQETLVRGLVDQLIREQSIAKPWCWFYSPMMFPLGEHIDARRVIYDCMDELSAFAGAPPGLREREARLLRRADVVFTGGSSLFESKRGLHANVHAFPSSVDVGHFAKSKTARDPADQEGIPHPRVGFFGVIDERLDVELIRELADARPMWHFVMVGPVVKIDPGILPRAANVHWVGGKSYADLPQYLGGWEVAILPFALNEATRFISPTKTLEYLAAGKPVVSTAIRDVVHPYGEGGLVRIADRATFGDAIASSMERPFPSGEPAVAAMLAGTSWDRTWTAMKALVVSSRAPRPSIEASSHARTTSRTSEAGTARSERNSDT